MRVTEFDPDEDYLLHPKQVLSEVEFTRLMQEVEESRANIGGKGRFIGTPSEYGIAINEESD